MTEEDTLKKIDRIRVKWWNANLDGVPDEIIKIVDEMNEAMSYAEEELADLRRIMKNIREELERPRLTEQHE